MSAYIYIEGGGDSKELHIKCRQGFRRLLERCGFSGRMPRLVACGGRGATFDDFTTAHAGSGDNDYIAIWIDSEDPMADIEKAWDHLQARDGWTAPGGADDEQVLLMITCMETWILTDRATLSRHFGARLQTSALPALHGMETRTRDSVQAALVHATRNCGNAYAKGKRSFEVLGKLDPAVLRQHLPGFARCERILQGKL